VRIGARSLPAYGALLILLFLAAYPMIFMLINAFKDGLQYNANPLSFALSYPLGKFFATAWQYLAPAFVRTAIITFSSVAGVVAFAMLSAYAFARIDFYGRTFLFYAVFGLLLVPGFLTLIPLVLDIRHFGLLNNYFGLILPYVAGGQAFAIFVFRGFIEGLPSELFEAARVDGAGELYQFLRIVLPLSIPVMITIALLNITGIWGDYVFPSLIMSISNSTVAMAIGNFQPPPSVVSVNIVNLQFAAYTLASIPMILLFLFFMRHFVAGITSGAIKM
jgi:ABC-type glycerol-3-phosphate transport system permease component